DQPAIYGGDHAATSDVAYLLRLHHYPVANLDHDRLLWMVTKPGHPKCPHDRRLHSKRPVAAFVLAIQSSHPAACDTTAHAESIAVGNLLAMPQPRDAEQLATEPGCEVLRARGRRGRAAGWPAASASWRPTETTCRAGNRPMLADARVSFRKWLPSPGRSRQAGQATGVAACLLPVGMSRMPSGLAR